MSFAVFDAAMGWDYHPQLLIALIFIGLLCIMLPDPQWWAAIIAAALIAIPLMLLLLIPYFIIISALALSLSLLQAIATGFRRSNPATRSFPIR